ncbi:hypothetical protein M3Y98_00876700 [Aphelenchoides besseyi]|nr:hypothetical protein M3Y98_00876700 [Aphelenchoides besseyi]KAI6195015.1 hypothetical protein M3Y96_01186200 [Aphelenchoides besseyi]
MSQRYWRLYRTAVASLFLCLSVNAQSTTSTSSTSNRTTCKHSGHRFVHDYIQFQCYVDDAGKLQLRPIGCVPTNSSTGTAISPGQTFTSEHFRYACVRRSNDTLVLKITHCIDNSGLAVALGEYFNQKKDNSEHESMECVGNELKAKKVVFKWSKCRLRSGDLLTEGNFLTEPVAPELLRTPLQTEEIISCKRNSDKEIGLQCTGCVAVSGIHVPIAAYANIHGQWTQCRKYAEGCRLINVTNIVCHYNNKTYDNGEVFRSKSGRSTFICDYGVVNKQGCYIEDELVAVGDVKYVRGVPLLCDQSDEIGDFGELKGCKIDNKTEKRFLETWTDGQLKKRCSWTRTENGEYHSEIMSYACVLDSDEIPLNKIVQTSNGSLLKCAPTDTGELEMRELNANEHDDYVKKKTSRLNLIEYYGSGSRGEEPKSMTNDTIAIDELCNDLLPFCSRLSAYCGPSKLPEMGLLLDAYEKHARLQEMFENLTGAQTGQRKPLGCEEQLPPFRKLEAIVELACPRTCQKCLTRSKYESSISNLEKTSHCGW